MGWVIVAVLGLMGLALVSYLRLGVLLNQDQMVLQVGWLGHRLRFDQRQRWLDWWWLGLHLLHRPLRRGQAKKKPRKSPPKQPQAPPSLASVWQQRARMVKLLQYLRRHLRLEKLELWLRLSAPDPALTGMLYGLFYSLPPQMKHHLQVGPEFMEEWPLGSLEAAIKIRTVDLLVLGWQGYGLARAVSPRNSKERSMVWKAKTY